MSVVYLVLPLALVIVGVAVWAFVWSARSGQFDDLDTPALRMLHDDASTAPPARPRGGRSPRPAGAEPPDAPAPRD